MAPKDNNEQIELQQHYTYNSNSSNSNKRRKRMINNNSNKNDDEGTRRISIAEAEEANKAKAAAAEAAAANHFGTNLRKQVAKLAGQAAKKRLNEIQRSSQLTIEKEEENNNNTTNTNTQLSWDDIFVEDMLGMGSFASVCLVTCPKLRRKQQQQKENELMNNKDNRTSATDDYSLSGSMMSYSNLMSYASGSGASTCSEDYSTLDPMKYYACKSLSNKTVHHTNVRGFISAAADLIHESFLLSNLSQHPNIVRLYGKPKDSDIDNAFQNDNGEDTDNGNRDDLGYFLIMEALTGGVLNEKISHWYHSKQIQKTQYKRRRSSLTLTTTAHSSSQKQQQPHSQQQQQQEEVYAASLSSFLGSQQKQNQNQNQQQPHDQYQHVAPQRTSSAISALSQNSTTNSYTRTSARTRRNNNIPLLQERLDIALQIATGMIHLHNNHIIFRDLKPHNVGLSSRPSDSSCDTNNDGVIENKLTWRLFDFGLAREVPSSNRFGSTTGCGSGSGNTRLDGVVHGKSGSLRYMAPETMGGKWLRRTTTTTGGGGGGGPTSVKNSQRSRNNNDNNGLGCFATYGSDVFGFAIVLWELVSLEDFDHQYDTNPMKFEEAVCDYNHRPNINVITNELINDYDGDCNSNTGGTGTNTSTKTEMIGVILRNLIESCWDEDYKNRPSFESISVRLHEIISLLSSHSLMKKQISRRSSISRHSRSSLRSSDDHGTTTASNNNNNSNIGISSSDESIMNNIQFNNSMVLQDPEQNNNVHNNTAAHFDNDNSKKDDKFDQDDIESDNYENGDDGDDIDLEQQSISLMNGSLLSLMNESFKSMGTSNCDGGASASNTAATNFSSRTCDLIGGGSSSGKVGGAFLSYDDDDNDDDDDDGEEDEDDEEEYDDAIDESMGMDNDYSSSNITTTSWNNGRLLSDGATTMSISRLSVGGSTSFSNFSFSSFKNNIGGTASRTNRGSDDDGCGDGDGGSSLKKYLASTNNNNSSSKAAAITATFGSSSSLSL